VSKMGNFIVWAEENGWCEHDGDDYVWYESSHGEAYQAYLDVQKEENNE